MNYLIVDYNSVFVAKNDVATIKAKIQGIDLQKPMLLTWYIHNQFAALSYGQQVLNLLVEDFASGFSKIEEYKRKLNDELQRGNGNYSYALWIASDILRHLRFSLDYAIAFDRLPHCDMLISHVRDEVIKGVSRSANNATIELMGTVLSLAFKIKDINDIGKVFWFYNRLVTLLGENPNYDNERNLLNWAKGQRAHAFFAFVPTLVGGAASIAHIIDEATAQHDMDCYGQCPLDVVINNL